MEKLFADHETSKMLKELGFKESCFGEYDQLGGFRYCNMSAIVIDEFTGNTIPSPIWQQVKQWLWEKHNIWNEITCYETLHGFAFEVIVYKGNLNDVLHQPYRDENVIQAGIEGIKKAVEYLHKQP